MGFETLTFAPIDRALDSFARSSGSWVIAEASEPKGMFTRLYAR